MKRPLVYYDDPRLRSKSLPIEQFDENTIKLIKDLIDTMDACNGIGLAAIQIGVPLKAFVIREYTHNDPQDPWKLSEPFVYINPVLSEPTKELIEHEEGCLSLPKLYLPVKRPMGIKVNAFDQFGNPFEEVVSGYKARQIMHENDHTNGVLLIDRIDPGLRKKIAKDLRYLKTKYEHKSAPK